MAEVKWIKLSTDIFNNRKIRQIEAMPDSDALIVIWLKILILAGTVNDGGMIYFTKDIPYTDQLLATEFHKPIATIQLALNIFEQFGMIEITDNIIYVSNWEKYQSAEKLDEIREQTRQRVARFREKQKALPCNATSNATVTQCNATDIDIEREEEKERDTEITTEEPPKRRGGVFQRFAGEDKELASALKEFNEFRNRKKKPMTDEAKERLCRKLEKFPREEWIAIIHQSIDQGWTDIYPLKGVENKETEKSAPLNRNFKVSGDPDKWANDSFKSKIADLMGGEHGK